MQSDDTGDIPLIDHCKEYIKQKYEKPGAVFLEPVHRIDRPVSGIVIMARTSKSLERMNEIFRRKEIEKKYFAIVKNQPREMSGRLIHWLIRDREKRKSFVYEKQAEGSLNAELHYEVLIELQGKYLLEIILQTGRPHQIRAQLAAISSPIQGDLKYGAPKANSDGNISLHNRYVSFLHPVKKEKIEVKAPLLATVEWQLFLTLAENR